MDEMKINITIEIQDCPYWNYDEHKPKHTCRGCECLWEGNTIRNANYGVMVGIDRYCTIDSKIYNELVEKLEQE